MRDFGSWGEYLDWLKAEYDDGTIRWEDDGAARDATGDVCSL